MTIGTPETMPDDRLVEPVDLTRIGDELARAATGSSGRAARTLLPGSGTPLKQTVLALSAGRRLQEHVAPGPATLVVLRGTVVLSCAGESQQLADGTWVAVPRAVHDLEAISDAVVLLTVSTSTDGGVG